MANRERNEATVEVDGVVYRLQLSINAMCEVEDLLSAGGKRVGWNTWVKDVVGAEMTWRDLRLIMWAACREHHPEVTVQKAGWLMDRIGWHRSTATVLVLFPGTTADDADLRALGVALPDPPEARQNGTGGRSKSRPARSASRAETSGTAPSASSSASS